MERSGMEIAFTWLVGESVSCSASRPCLAEGKNMGCARPLVNRSRRPLWRAYKRLSRYRLS